MSKTIRMTLGVDSINKAIEELELYRARLKQKTSLFCQRLAEIGLTTIEAHKYSEYVSSADYNDLRSYVWLEESGSSATATLVLNGKDVAFIEFGTGVHYNGPVGGSPNPFGQQFGMTIGSYGKGKGAQDSWVYFDEELHRFHKTNGIKAAQPMAYADEEIRKRFLSVAKEVFGNE